MSAKQSEEFAKKYESYKKTSIEKYLEQVGSNNQKKYSWMIGSNANTLKIYKSETEHGDKVITSIVSESTLQRYSGDQYYVVFPKKQVLCWVYWFI